MKKILVTTDLSVKSKAALKFAIQLASQGNYSLTFFHSYRILRPTSWNEEVFRSFEIREVTKLSRKLSNLVQSVYKSLKILNKEPECVIESGVSAYRNIKDYASEHGYNLICMSRKGAGNTSKLFGSIISKLITKSTIPVIAVPENYKIAPIDSITFASDLLNLDNELEKVLDFTQSLGAKVELLHIQPVVHYVFDGFEFDRIRHKLDEHQIAAHFERSDFEQSLVGNINTIIRQFKPSMLIMFTDQDRDLFEKIFMPSTSVDFYFISTVPLLVFSKPPAR